MKFLFVHQNYPGQFLHIVRHLAEQGGHEIVFASQMNANVIAGVRRVLYSQPRGPVAELHPAAQEFDMAMLRAAAVANMASNLNELGFTPDIVIGHQGWGEMLDLQDVWRDTPRLGYLEFYYHTDDHDVGFDPEFPPSRTLYPLVRAKNAINHLALNSGAVGFTPTEFQRSTYPDWARPKIELLREGVHLDICAPDPKVKQRLFRLGGIEIAPGEKLVTYVARDLEPYRGFHIMMRALPRILAERKDARVVIVGGDGVSYGSRPANGTWREMMLRELGDRLDLSRVHFAGKLHYEDYSGLLKRSDAHVYLTYPFVASWSLREALASGCAIVASDTAPVREFVTHDRTGLLVDFHQPDAVAEQVLRLLDDRRLSGRLSAAARRHAEQTLDMDDYLNTYVALIEKLTGREVAPVPAERAAPPARVRGRRRVA